MVVGEMPHQPSNDRPVLTVVLEQPGAFAAGGLHAIEVLTRVGDHAYPVLVDGLNDGTRIGSPLFGESLPSGAITLLARLETGHQAVVNGHTHRIGTRTPNVSERSKRPAYATFEHRLPTASRALSPPAARGLRGSQASVIASSLVDLSVSASHRSSRRAGILRPPPDQARGSDDPSSFRTRCR